MICVKFRFDDPGRGFHHMPSGLNPPKVSKCDHQTNGTVPTHSQHSDIIEKNHTT